MAAASGDAITAVLLGCSGDIREHWGGVEPRAVSGLDSYGRGMEFDFRPGDRRGVIIAACAALLIAVLIRLFA